jgi:site-specific DNA recombinase
VAQAAPPARLRPNTAEIYKAKVADLAASLNAPEIRAEASDAVRSVIDRVVLTPDAMAPDGLAAALYGDLAMILTLAAQENTLSSRRRSAESGTNKKLPRTDVRGSLLSVVAGIGFEPMTFRL